MTKDEQLKKALRDLAGHAQPFLQGKVKEVQGDVCTVVLSSGLELVGVKLKAAIGEDDGLVMEPLKDSTVLVADLGNNLTSLTVIAVERVAKCRYQQDGLEVLIDSTDKKISIKNGQQSLVDLFDQLSTLLSTFTVSTPSGPSGTPLPPTVQAINQFKTAFKQLLK